MKIPKKVLFRLILSYTAIVVILLTINLFVSRQSENILSQKILSIRDALLTQQKVAIDEGLKECYRITSSLGVEKEVLSYANFDKHQSGESVLLAHSIQSKLQEAKYMNDMISDIYIYFNIPERCLSSSSVHTPKEVYLEYHSEYSSFEEWQSFINTFHTNDLGCLTPENTGGSLIYTHSVKDLGQTKATIVIILEKKFFQNLKKTENETILILDENGICYTSGEIFNVEYKELAEKKGRVEKKINGKQYSVAYVKSDVAKLKYLSVLDTDDFWADSQKYQRLLLLCLLLSLIIGALISFYSLRKNYAPIKEILNILPEDGGEGSESIDEFKLIKKTLQNTLCEVQTMQNVIKKQKKKQSDSLLLKILRGKIESPSYIKKVLEQSDISFDNDGFVVVLFYVEYFESLMNENEDGYHNDTELLRLIIKNVLGEILSEEFNVAVLDVDELTVAAVINYSYKNDFEAVEHIREKIEQGQKLLEKEFSVQYFTSISLPKQGIASLPKAFSEAENTKEYKITMELENKILCYKDIQEAESIYNYSREVETQLKNLIDSGNADDAIATMKELFRENTENKKISNDVLQCLKFSVLNVILQRIEQEEDFVKDLEPVQKISAVFKVSDIVSVLEEILKDVCKYINERKMTETQISKKIKNYILQNYQNTELNVNAVAGAFGLTPYYLSKKFREEAGESILEYINKVRIEKAKELLLSSNKKIDEIAGKVGYTNTVTFNRVFKKCEGVSPGKFNKKQ